MTPRERADIALSRVRTMLEAGELDAARFHIEQAIIAAVAEEREECAKIAESYERERRRQAATAKTSGYGDIAAGYAAIAEQAKMIMVEIRARSERDAA